MHIFSGYAPEKVCIAHCTASGTSMDFKMKTLSLHMRRYRTPVECIWLGLVQFRRAQIKARHPLGQIVRKLALLESGLPRRRCMDLLGLILRLRVFSLGLYPDALHTVDALMRSDGHGGIKLCECKIKP